MSIAQPQPRTVRRDVDSDDRPTPQRFFDQLNREFGFTLDAAASIQNAKCGAFFSKDHDALAQNWCGVVWCNPPYGIHVGRWVEKGYLEAQDGATVVMLLPANTDTRWFHDFCLKGEIRFIKGRLQFGNTDSVAPFASMVVIFRPCFSSLLVAP